MTGANVTPAAWNCNACGAQAQNDAQCALCGASRPPVRVSISAPKLGPARVGVGAAHTQIREPVVDALASNHPLLAPPFEPERRPLRTLVRRTGWLTVLVVTATVGVIAVALYGGGHGAAVVAGVASERILSERIALSAGPATLGLDEDSKEVVMNLCWRTSGNPNVECRLAWLEQRGELPPRTIDAPALSVDRHEASNADWQRCVDAGGCAPRAIGACRMYTQRGYRLGETIPAGMLRPEHPAICVSAEEAQAYCGWRGGRLPTADEWERVARDGETRLQPWGTFWSPGIANWGERDMAGFPIAGRLDGFELTAPVDAFVDGRTPSGVEQVLGNVAEWVAADDEERSRGRAGVRGGDYTTDVATLRATWHTSIPADERRSTVGVRCVYDEAR